MGKPVVVFGKITAAKYYPGAGSFVLLVLDLERKKHFKPIEVTPATFGIASGLPDDSYHFFAKELEGRKDPIRIEFQGDLEFDEAVKKAFKNVDGKTNDAIQHELDDNAKKFSDMVERIKNDDGFIMRQLRGL